MVIGYCLFWARSGPDLTAAFRNIAKKRGTDILLQQGRWEKDKTGGSDYFFVRSILQRRGSSCSNDGEFRFQKGFSRLSEFIERLRISSVVLLLFFISTRYMCVN
jgi:hypothetical protein